MTPPSLLTVCLIVKDEEQMLAACLQSVADVADEIVVYDTGSSDRTVQIARDAGAHVIEGYWDDSFARARNAALEHAKGEWVLSIDADERLLADPGTLRAVLADPRSDVEAYLVAIENLHGVGNARSVHTAVRMFRRTACTWRHRLHEQVTAVDDAARRLRIGYLSGSRIIHHGYVAEVFDSKNKTQRNLELAEAALNDVDLGRAYALMNYGRALESAGRSEEAVVALREAAALSDDEITQRMALKNLIYILGRLGRFDETLEQINELRRISVNQIAADIAEGRTLISMGSIEAGLSLLERVPLRGRDDDGMEYAAHMLAAMQGEALASLGHYGEAADVVLDAVRSDGVLEADLGELSFWLMRANRPLAEIADALDVADLMAVLGRVLRQSLPVADAILEGISEKFPERLEPLAAAGRLAPRLPVARALVWSSRLRAHGLDGACPLVAIVKNQTLDPRVRILAGAAAFGSFGELGVVDGVHEARSRLDEVALGETTDEIGRLAPGLLEAQHVEPVAIRQADANVPSRGAERGRPVQMARETIKVTEVTRRGGFNIVGPFEDIGIDGDVARTLAKVLLSHGVPVSTTSFQSDGRRGVRQWTHHDHQDHPFDTTLFVLTPEELVNFVIDRGAAAFENRYIIGVWHWDFDQPSEFLKTAARMVHEIWVPSNFSAAAVAQVTERHVVTMPTSLYEPEPHDRDVITESGFAFLASVDYETGFQRQNPLGVVSAFCTAFPSVGEARLVIETIHAHGRPYEHAQLVAAVQSRPDISLSESVHRSAGHVLAGRSATESCFVSLHRSEGTGLVLARAMALGIPTIVTKHSFSAEYQGELDSFQISCDMRPIPLSEHRFVSDARWAEPDIVEAARAMRSVIEQPVGAINRSLKARERERRQFGAPRAVRIMKDRLAAIDAVRSASGAPTRSMTVDRDRRTS